MKKLGITKKKNPHDGTRPEKQASSSLGMSEQPTDIATPRAMLLDGLKYQMSLKSKHEKKVQAV